MLVIRSVSTSSTLGCPFPPDLWKGPFTFPETLPCNVLYGTLYRSAIFFSDRKGPSHNRFFCISCLKLDEKVAFLKKWIKQKFPIRFNCRRLKLRYIRTGVWPASCLKQTNYLSPCPRCAGAYKSAPCRPWTVSGSRNVSFSC